MRREGHSPSPSWIGSPSSSSKGAGTSRISWPSPSLSGNDRPFHEPLPVLSTVFPAITPEGDLVGIQLLQGRDKIFFVTVDDGDVAQIEFIEELKGPR